jgi:hypothetical protein
MPAYKTVDSAMTGTFIDLAEAMVEDVAHWAVDYVNDVVKLIAPDGRAFGKEKQTEREKMAEYMKIRGNPQAWQSWIESVVTDISNKLTESGLSPELVASTHPYDIAFSFAVKYSKNMESLLVEEEEKVRERYAPSPAVVDVDLEDYKSFADEEDDDLSIPE